ncbi:MAG: hypothetical protein ACO1OO_15600 [Flavisolibacter sp.]
MKGLEEFTFAESYKEASVAEIDGVMVPIIQINHLLKNKKAVNRPKDQLDVIYLEKIIGLQNKKP